MTAVRRGLTARRVPGLAPALVMLPVMATETLPRVRGLVGQTTRGLGPRAGVTRVARKLTLLMPLTAPGTCRGLSPATGRPLGAGGVFWSVL